MRRTENGPSSHDRPIRLAFYGLAAAELDLFTQVKRHDKASLVLVVDPGPMAIARRLAEIAGVQASCNPWDLSQADLDWIVTGRLARMPGAPLERAVEGGAEVLDVAEALERLAELGRAEPEPAAEERERREVAVESAPQEDLKPPQPAEPHVEIEEEAAAAETEEEGAEEAEEAEAAATAAAEDHGARRRPERVERADESAARPAASPRRPYVGLPALSPMNGDTEVSRVVGWALDGMMSSVRSGWGVAVARTNGDLCLVQRGIELERARPELLRWLRREVESDEASGDEPPSGSDALVWVPLRAEAALVGMVLLGKESEGESFSSLDRAWLHKVGERIASILCSRGNSELGGAAASESVAPALVWAAPILERAIWARGWLRERFEASGCWLFAAAEGYSEPQLIDETWGASPPPFLRTTIMEAMERAEPQVWLESGERKALVIQPLSPWGIAWLAVLEGMPWRGDGKAALARLKKDAATVARLLKTT